MGAAVVKASGGPHDAAECKASLASSKEWLQAQQGPKCSEEFRQALRVHAMASPSGGFCQGTIQASCCRSRRRGPPRQRREKCFFVGAYVSVATSLITRADHGRIAWFEC